MYEYVADAYGKKTKHTVRDGPNGFVYCLNEEGDFLLLQMSLFLAHHFCASFLLSLLSNCFVWQRVTFSSPAASSQAALSQREIKRYASLNTSHKKWPAFKPAD